MAARPLYIVAEWDIHFETYESKRLAKACAWVAMPNKHDGKSYRRLTRERDAVALYGAWAALVQVASKCAIRGTLADLDGPLDAADLEDKTGLPCKSFERILSFASTERIGWLEKVTDAELIDTIEEAIRAKKSGTSRTRPQTPAALNGHPHAPADSGPSAGTPADSADPPHAPADSRTPAGVAALRGRALADRTGPDRTGPDKTALSDESESGRGSRAELEATGAFLISLFQVPGKKRTALSSMGTHGLSGCAQDLPLDDAQKALLAWFYGLPADDQNQELRTRRQSADRLACDLFGEIERAAAYAKKTGAAPRPAVPAPAPSEPAGWRQWFADRFPDHDAPPTWFGLPESVRSEFSLKGVA